MRVRSGPGHCAFTLIEIMIALTIFSIVIAAIYSCFSAIVRSTGIAHSAAAEVQRERIAVRALEEALFSVQFFQENARYYSFEADTSGDFAALSFVSRLPESFPRSGNFEGQVLRRLTFSVESGAGGGNALVLRQTPVLFESNVDEEENPLVLVRDVREFVVEFWGQNSRDWEPEWLYTNQLPRMIRYSLLFGHGKQRAVAPGDGFSNIIMLKSNPIPSGMQAAAPQGAAQGGGKGPPVK
jgi:prepilin-type N-terminal cleavage/methylation domain-containing protein